jgi:hypothetical protein
MLKRLLALSAISSLAVAGFPGRQLAGQAPAAQELSAERLVSVSLPASLEKVLRGYESAWQAGDEEALAGLFVEDGLVPGRLGWLRGRTAIRDKYRDSSGDLRLRAIAFSTDGNVGFIVGAYGYADEAAVRDQGNFILALERDAPDSPWLIVADLDRGLQAAQG